MFTSFARLLAMEFQKLGEGVYLNSFNQPFYPEHIFSTQLSQKAWVHWRLPTMKINGYSTRTYWVCAEWRAPLFTFSQTDIRAQC
jgi:hypothetical protein